MMISKIGVWHIALALAVILGAVSPLAACICPDEAVCCKANAECGPKPARDGAESDACEASCCGGATPVSGGDTAAGTNESGGCHCQVFPLEKLPATPPALGGAAPETAVYQLPVPSFLAPCPFVVFSTDGGARPPGDSIPLHVRVCAWRC